MFHLEQSIANWREQMLAAGIQAPVPLDELEIHLREEIEQQTKSGLAKEEAFKTAVLEVGQGGLLKAEFAKAGGLWSRYSSNKFINVMKQKIGVSIVVTALFMAAILQLAGAPLVARMSITTHQGGHTMVDNFWQIQWYAFMLAGFLVVGIVLVVLSKRKTSTPATN